MSKEKFLKGRVAMVTGGASGMGRAMVLAFAEAGADIAIGSRGAAMSPCKDEIEARGVKALAINNESYHCIGKERTQRLERTNGIVRQQTGRWHRRQNKFGKQKLALAMSS